MGAAVGAEDSLDGVAEAASDGFSLLRVADFERERERDRERDVARFSFSFVGDGDRERERDADFDLDLDRLPLPLRLLDPEREGEREGERDRDLDRDADRPFSLTGDLDLDLDTARFSSVSILSEFMTVWCCGLFLFLSLAWFFSASASLFSAHQSPNSPSQSTSESKRFQWIGVNTIINSHQP